MKKGIVILLVSNVVLLFLVIYLKLNSDNLADIIGAQEKEFRTYKQNEIVLKKQEAQRKQDEKSRLEKLKQAQLVQKQKELLQKRREALQLKVENAYQVAQQLAKKYKKRHCKKAIILEALNQHKVYVKNFNGNSLGDVNVTYLKDGLRAIGLEEIQKVGRYKEGYIDIIEKGTQKKQTIYVKNLDMFGLYVGASEIFR